MDYRSIKGKRHYVFDSVDEMEQHLNSETPRVLNNWREVEEGDWVLSDDGRIIQLLRVKRDFKHPNDRKNYRYAKGWVRTVVGTFLNRDRSFMDTDFGKHKNRYTFSGKHKNPNRAVKTRKKVTKKEKMFATSVAIGKGVISAYKDAFGNIPDERAKQKGIVLLKQERVMKEVEKSVLDVAKSLGVDHEYILRSFKCLVENSDDENIVLQSTKELGKAIGTVGGIQTRNLEMGIYGMVQEFSPDELEEAARPKLEVENGDMSEVL